jgi:hypothetical protein
MSQSIYTQFLTQPDGRRHRQSPPQAGGIALIAGRRAGSGGPEAVRLPHRGELSTSWISVPWSETHRTCRADRIRETSCILLEICYGCCRNSGLSAHRSL